jgi:hypothetical protein
MGNIRDPVFCQGVGRGTPNVAMELLQCNINFGGAAKAKCAQNG